MKKIAIFVEGQTEQFFINKLLIEIAGEKNIAIILKKFIGKGQPKKDVYPKSLSQGISPKHTALIYDCGSDESVKTRILEEYQNLFSQDYTEIIGIRDLHPLENLQKLESRLLNGLIKNGRITEAALPYNTSIIVAVYEIEAWFLSECNHFSCIDINLTKELISRHASRLGFDPYIDDMTLLPKPSDCLKDVYQIVGKTYSKKKNHIERTVECLDYSNVYIGLRDKIQKLADLIFKIDTFLT